MNAPWRSNSLAVFAWLDSSSGPDVAIVAVDGGRAVPAGVALARIARSGSAAAPPWISSGSPAGVPVCAFAAIVGDVCVRSGFAAFPARDDITRFASELRAAAGTVPSAEIERIVGPAECAIRRDELLEIDVFTGTARRDGRELAFPDGEFAVLAAFAMNRTACSREEWCDVLWPDRDADSAARLLKVYVHRIRSKFAHDGIIETHGGGYRLGAAVRVDVHALGEFARRHPCGARLDPAQLADVRRAFQGLCERRYRRLAVLDAYPELERRIIATGAELARILADDAMARGEAAAALEIAEQLASIDPYDDVAIGLLMRAHIMLGRGDVACRHFRIFCRTLHDELDLPPPPHLVRLLAEPAGV